MQQMLDAGARYGLRNYFRGGYLPALTDEVISVVLEYGQRLPSPMSQIHLHQMGAAVSRIAHVCRHTAAGRPPTPTTCWGSWTDPAADEINIEAVRQLSEALAPESSPERYVNFDPGKDADEQRVRAAYGDDIYARASSAEAGVRPDVLPAQYAGADMVESRRTRRRDSAVRPTSG